MKIKFLIVTNVQLHISDVVAHTKVVQGSCYCQPADDRGTVAKCVQWMLFPLSEHMKKLEEEERARKEAEEAAYAARMEEQAKQEAEEKGIIHVLTSLLSQ